MTITVKELLRCADSGVLAHLASQRLPVASAFKLRRLMHLIHTDALTAQQQRNSLFTPLNSDQVEGMPDGVRTIRPEFLAEFQRDIAPLLAVEVYLAAERLLPEDLAGAAISVAELDALGPLLVTD